jgi:hypothetical protein
MSNNHHLHSHAKLLSPSPATPPFSASSAGAVVVRSLDDLKPNPKTARTHFKRKIKDLASTIRTVGFIGVIVVDESGMILAGHARYAAAKILGLTAVPTICVRGLSDELVRAFVLADNEFSERARVGTAKSWRRSLKNSPFCYRRSTSIYPLPDSKPARSTSFRPTSEKRSPILRINCRRS